MMILSQSRGSPCGESRERGCEPCSSLEDDKYRPSLSVCCNLSCSFPSLIFHPECNNSNSRSTNTTTVMPTLTELQTQASAEAACYSLPYGGIGFASHIVTYYTIVMLILGRQPLRPWKWIKHKLRSIVLSAVQLIATIILSSLAISKCRKQWEFVVLSV